MVHNNAIRLFAEKLHDDIFSMRHGDELGPVEEAMPKDKLRPILAAKLKEAGIVPSEAQLTALVLHFPIIDVDPTDAHPFEDEVFEREVGYLTKLLEQVVPELAHR